ncbi:ABC transporter substrate-binding protein [Lacrimispora sp.]|uniref:ABC transporter substrate-binding protein n=1 Tax=Lacrimispora sp. TaxID=2719234 RepID=UPI002FD9B03E
MGKYWRSAMGFAAAAAVLGMLSGCQTGTKSADGKETVTLGVVGPLTGNAAASGQVQANAVEMAVEEINAAGGVDGKYMIKLVKEDDEGVPAKSVTVTQKLVNQNNIDVLIGALNSSCTLADMEITAANKIPQITPCSSAQSIVEQGNEFIFRTTATDTTHIKTLLQYFRDKIKGKKVAVLYESSDFGTGAFSKIQEMAPEYGAEVAASEMYNSGEKDFSVHLTKIKQANPDAIIIWGYYTEAALISKQVKQNGIEVPLIGTGYNSPKLVELGGDAVNGLIFTTAFTEANPDEKVQAFDKKYKEIYQQSYDQNAPQAYDSVYLWADAVKRAGTVDGQAVRDALLATKDFEGVAGIYNFSPNGEMVKTLMVVQIQDGKHTIIPMD